MVVPVFPTTEVVTNTQNDKNFCYSGQDLAYLGTAYTGTEEAPLPVTLYLTGHDPKGTIPFLAPRPPNSIFLKLSDFIEPRKTKKEPVNNACGQILGWRYQYDPSDPPKGKLHYSDDPDIKDKLRTPGAESSLVFSDISEKQTKSSTTLLIIRRNIIRKFYSLYECTFYWGIPDPVDEPQSNGELVTVDFVFSPIYNTTHKAYARTWYVRIYQDGTNELLEKADVRALVYGTE